MTANVMMRSVRWASHHHSSNINVFVLKLRICLVSDKDGFDFDLLTFQEFTGHHFCIRIKYTII